MSSPINVITHQLALEQHIKTSFRPKEDLTTYLRWKQDAFRKLETFLSTFEIEVFHQRRLSWIRTESQSHDLERLCVGVISRLRIAIQKTRQLQYWASGEIYSARDQRTGMNLALQASRAIRLTFQEFEVVSGNHELLEDPNNNMVIKYLEKVLNLSFVLGRLVGFESWYDCLDEDMGPNLDTFIFDSLNDYRKRSNTSLAGVIADHREVPRSFLPVEPQRPIVYRSPYPYGAAVLWNVPD
ncbi:hypothetical protein HYALB_00003544 [Hymenoscyphus albidus]|uniref:Uncharacterized protein n=1 Tax=Hymenoscyphus albidus TaxID=595503 RepID=A0A9N9Q7N1_9HELO|nr:hypothetical protein HYALB_00003544 [Hymenoscyphus albidus]